jgi:hypothetical protein
MKYQALAQAARISGLPIASGESAHAQNSKKQTSRHVIDQSDTDARLLDGAGFPPGQ